MAVTEFSLLEVEAGSSETEDGGLMSDFDSG